MAKRSPILGFNHNFRHRGLVFHVQTEDSGIENPHIFTHLFNGGVILSSRKLTYDSGSAEEVVKALMQAQHKAMLKDLKKGTFDDKIDNYFSDRPELEPRRTQDTLVDVPGASAPSPRARTPEPSELELDLEDIEIVGGPADTLRNPAPASSPRVESAPVVIHAQAPELDTQPVAAARRPGAYARHRSGAYERVEEAKPPKPQAEPEVVARPSVIVGAPPKVVGARPQARRAREGSASLFGKDLISEKSLDEVILAYLSEDGSGRDSGG